MQIKEENLVSMELVRNFYSLDGIKIGEKRKSLFRLLQTTSNHLQGNQADDFINAVVPTSYLETRFKLDILIHFKKITCLIDVLKSEDDVLIGKLLKVSWFYEEAFKNVDGYWLVHELFPFVSYSTRCKIVSKLSIYLRNERQAEDFFEAIKKKYGLPEATRLLPACSSEFVLATIRSNKIKIGCRHLLYIIRKNANIVSCYFHELYKRSKRFPSEYTPVFKYLSLRHTSLFIKLFEIYEPNILLGCRSTLKVINANKQEIIENSKKFMPALNPQQTRICLKEDFKEYYSNLFPNSHTDFAAAFENHENNHFSSNSGYLYSLIQHLPVQLQLDLLTKSFYNAYKASIWDYPNYITPQLMKMLPLEQREKWVHLKCKAEYEEDKKWMCFLTAEQWFAKAKILISLTSDISSRSRLIVSMAKCCSINRDTTALADLCKYVIKRHRNDDVTVRHNFLDSVNNYFDIKLLNEIHWECIRELVQISDLTTQIYPNKCLLLEKYIHYRILNNMEIHEEVKLFLILKEGFDLLLNTKYEKHCLLLMGSIISDTFSGSKLLYADMKYFERLIKWNTTHARDQISIFSYPRLIPSLISAIRCRKHDAIVQKAFTYCLRVETRCDDDIKYTLLHLFWASAEFDVNKSVWNSLMKRQPEIILKYLDIFMKFMLKHWEFSSSLLFWKMCKNFSHLEIPEKITRICLQVLGEENSIDKKEALVILSVLMEGNNYCQLIQQFVPSSGKGGTFTKKIVACALKNVLPPSLALENINRFYSKNNLRYAFPALYSLCCYVTGNNVVTFLNNNLDMPVSVRKHIIYLIFSISPIENKCFILKEYLKTEKDLSVLNFLFKKAVKSFYNNPSEDIWEVLKFYINAVEDFEKEKIGLFIQLKMIPYKYISEYVPFIWNTLQRICQKSNKGLSVKFSFLDSISVDIIPLIPSGFCIDIIEQNLFSLSQTSYQKSVCAFVLKSIFYSDSKVIQEQYFDFICGHLRALLVISKPESSGKIISKNMRNFINQFCIYVCRKRSLDKTLVHKFVTSWSELIQPHHAIEEFLTLKFVIFYIDSAEEEHILISFGRKIALYFDEVISAYGLHMVPIFGEVLQKFIDFKVTEVSENADNFYVFLNSILQSNESVNCKVMIVHIILYCETPTSNSAKMMYDNIIKNVLVNSEPIVLMYINDNKRF